jgi:hypothetical protein
MLAREQRVHTQVDALTAAQDDLRARRNLSTRIHDDQAGAGAPRGWATNGRRRIPPRRAQASRIFRGRIRPMASRVALDAYKYVGFEDRFRGSRDAIRERLSSYLPSSR